MIKEIKRSEFEKRFPEVSTCGFGLGNVAHYLEDGVVLLDSEWNGEVYDVDGQFYKPIYKWDTIADQGILIGYDVWEWGYYE